MSPFWLSAFLDFAPAEFDDGVDFWCSVTGYGLSETRGHDGEFRTLLPPMGDGFLRVQRLGEGPSRIHLDVHVADPLTATELAVQLGATVTSRPGSYVVLRSPGGLTFCLVSHRAATRPDPTVWPGGHRSIIDQACLDIPAATYDAERTFWLGLTGWELGVSAVLPEFSNLRRPPGIPLRILLQRLEEPDGTARAHLDLATSDRAAETVRHVALGAAVLAEDSYWTVLSGPTGQQYCITDRDPETGMLP